MGALVEGGRSSRTLHVSFPSRAVTRSLKLGASLRSARLPVPRHPERASATLRPPTRIRAALSANACDGSKRSGLPGRAPLRRWLSRRTDLRPVTPVADFRRNVRANPCRENDARYRRSSAMRLPAATRRTRWRRVSAIRPGSILSGATRLRCACSDVPPPAEVASATAMTVMPNQAARIWVPLSSRAALPSVRVTVREIALSLTLAPDPAEPLLEARGYEARYPASRRAFAAKSAQIRC